MAYKFFDKKSGGSGIGNEPNHQLADELHKQIIRKFKRRIVYSSFRDNIWGVGLGDMQSLSIIHSVQLVCLVICVGCSFERQKM